MSQITVKGKIIKTCVEKGYCLWAIIAADRRSDGLNEFYLHNPPADWVEARSRDHH